MNWDRIIAITLSLIVLISAFKYERNDLGCTRCFDPSVSACSDDNSVYVRGTRYIEGDCRDTIKRKLKHLLNHDEQSGSWKRCILWSFIMSIMGYAIYAKGGCIDGTNIPCGWLFLISWTVFFSILYALKSFESFHIFRLVKKNGFELVDRIT